MAHTVKKYFIQQFMQHAYLHGGIGCVDAEKVLLQNNFTPLLFPGHDSYSMKAKISRVFFLLRSFISLEKNCVVVFIFPLYARMDKWLIRLLRMRGDVKLICLIADINGLKDGEPALLEKEIAFFRHYTRFIVHNEKMKEWLVAKVPGIEAGVIDFFDFLTHPVTVKRNRSYDINFAGNLEKSGFLKDLARLERESPNLRFHLYGPGITPLVSDQSNVSYHGIATPYEMPGRLKGSFGLVWDGERMGGPGGSLGSYMAYISHHKLSLYIVSNLPVIVPVWAASAPLVEKYAIGMVVNSLYEVEERIGLLSDEEYRQMQENMRPLSGRISKGQCLEEALATIMRQLER